MKIKSIKTNNRLYPYTSVEPNYIICNNFNCKNILRNISILLNNSKKNYKKTILSLCSKSYPKFSLRRIGFKFSNKLYKNSLNQNDYYLNNNIIRRGKFDKVTKEKNSKIIKKYLKYYSNITSKFFRGEPLYYLQETKKTIYKIIKNQEPSINLGLNSFYKLCPKNFKNPKKESDKCPICKNGSIIEKKENINSNEKAYMEFYKKHKDCMS